MDDKLEAGILHQLALGTIERKGRKRVILVVDYPDHGGMTVRDAADLRADDLRDLWNDVRRYRAYEMRRIGLLKLTPKGTVRVAA